MRAMFIAGLIAASTPAHACHRYRVWHYPWPQRCGIARPVHPVAPIRRASETFVPVEPQKAKADWSGTPTARIDEIAPNDELGRNEALVKLRSLMK